MSESILCNILPPPKREKIFNSMEHDPETGMIYNSCNPVPVGYVKAGKIKWITKPKKQ